MDNFNFIIPLQFIASIKIISTESFILLINVLNTKPITIKTVKHEYVELANINVFH